MFLADMSGITFPANREYADVYSSLALAYPLCKRL